MGSCVAAVATQDFADAESQVAELAPLIGAALKERQDTDRIKKEVEVSVRTVSVSLPVWCCEWGLIVWIALGSQENIAYRQLKHDLEQHRKEVGRQAGRTSSTDSRSGR